MVIKASVDKDNRKVYGGDPTVYEVGKVSFIVSAVYAENTDKQICDLLIDLMCKDSEEVAE